SVADDKLAAIAGARRLLVGLPAGAAANDASWVQVRFWPDLPAGRALRPRPISRRRQEVFARSQGRCHYCRTSLMLAGGWHIEHQLPRALGGGDEPLNLVAACAPCNLAKRDRTALEYLTQEP
ncbi:MAG: HNH endonuclease, partial [Pseudomonadota bacterium]|nr:HNH endonuclease [Pseudomonadota bacterium]